MLLLNKIKLNEDYDGNYTLLADDLDTYVTNLTNRKYNCILDDDVFECPRGMVGKLDPQYYLDVEEALSKLIFLGSQTFLNYASGIIIVLMIKGIKNKHFYWTPEEIVQEYTSPNDEVHIRLKTVKETLENVNFFESDLKDNPKYYLNFEKLKKCLGM